MSPNESIEQTHVGFWNLTENVNCQRHLATEREGSDELRRDEEVSVKISFVNKRVNLLQLVKVCAFFKFRQLVFE